MRLLAAALLALAALPATAGTAAASPQVLFGIQDDAWLEHGPGTLSSRVARLDRLGVDVVRVTLHWHRIEQAPGRYDWARADRLLQALRRRGIQPVATIWGTPAWANGELGPNVAPFEPEHAFRFARAAAGRYRFVTRWLVWNEPNKPLWLNPASPETYVARILNPAYRGIKSANPRALVAGGVTAPRAGRDGVSPVDFLRRMDRAGAQLDVYAHHPYPVFPGDTPYRGGCRTCGTITMASLDRLVRLVAHAFPRARIWLTEYAYQSRPPEPFGVSLAQQARFIGEAARRVYLAPRVDMLVHYLYRDEPDLARWQSGLETVAGRPKPALAATALPLAQVARRGSRTVVWGQVRPGEGRQRYVLQRLAASRWVAIGPAARTSPRGYFVRTVTAPKGAKLRVWYPAQRLASPPLVVR
ncbi:MAG TPA: hypothetical protein VNJ46_09085 [Gaiellaceae bacterium]|nr:hypothetical protein [Gaiellaceae bacterium]